MSKPIPDTDQPVDPEESRSLLQLQNPPEELTELLKATPWRKIRPGVYTKQVTFRDLTFQRRLWQCQFCHEPYIIEAPVLKDIIWRQVSQSRKGIACVPCIESRLNRPIHQDDIKPNLPCNQSWLHTIPRSDSQNLKVRCRCGHHEVFHSKLVGVCIELFCDCTEFE